MGAIGSDIVFDHGKPHAPLLALFVEHRIHDFFDNMNTKAAGADIVQIAALNVAGIGLFAFVFDDDAQRCKLTRGHALVQHNINEPIGAALVPVVHYVGEGLIDGEHDFARDGVRKAAAFGEGADHLTDRAQVRGVAEHLHANVGLYPNI